MTNGRFIHSLEKMRDPATARLRNRYLQLPAFLGFCAIMADAYVNAVLSYAPIADWAKVLHCNDGDAPTSSRLEALRADYAMSIAGDRSRAMGHLMNAASAAVGVDDAYVEPLRLWIEDGNCAAAANAWISVLRANPTDMFALKRAQVMCLFSGENEKILEAALVAKEPAASCEHTAFYAGMLSFGYEQAGDFKRAELVAKEAGELAHDRDCWLQHAYAHALYFQGPERLREGIEYLSSRSSQWTLTRLMPFLMSHLWWHLALLISDAGDTDRALEIYTRRLWPKDADEAFLSDMQVQLNALLLLKKIWADNPEKEKDTLSMLADVIGRVQTIGNSDMVDPLHRVLVAFALGALGRNSDMRKHLEGQPPELAVAVQNILDRAAPPTTDSNVRRAVGGSTEQRIVLFGGGGSLRA